MTFRLAYFLIMFILFLSVDISYAQPPTGGGPGGGSEPVPLGGLEFLLLAGGALGIKKIIDRNKNKE